MIQITDLLHRLRSKTGLIIIAVVLVILNLGKVAMNYFEERHVHGLSRQDLLDQYRESAMEIDALRESVQRLEKRREEIDLFLFAGNSEEEIASSMQILLQEKVAKAGLAPESIRPIIRGDNKSEEKTVKGIEIKLRLSGTLKGFLDFIADLYRSNSLFRVESFVLKPFKGEEMKILLDVQGYYKLGKESKTGSAASVKRGSTSA